MEKYLIGYTTLKNDRVMHNNQFEYAASYEELTVKAGTYPIYVRKYDLRDQKVYGAYYGYTGTIIDSNVGGKKGDTTRYDLYTYGYSLAEDFLNGYRKFSLTGFDRDEVTLRDEWELYIADFYYDGERIFCLELRLKDGATPVEFD